jgi:hypothetical protein
VGTHNTLGPTLPTTACLHLRRVDEIKNGMRAANANNDTHSGILNHRMPFDEIRSNETSTKWNAVHCSIAGEYFRAGESVEVDPPVHIDNYVAKVAAILKVDQQSSPQRVLLSLFLNSTTEMKLKLNPPNDRSYIQYPSQLVVWTRYQGWFPTTRIKHEAFVLLPWEIDEAIYDAQVSIGMKNAYCIVGKWDHENPTAQAFESLGHGRISIPGCLHLAMMANGATQRYFTFRSTVAIKIADALSKASLATRTRQTINIDGVPECLWENFKKWTIPFEETERNGILTKRTIRQNFAIEMLRDTTTKNFARFDTLQRFDLLKGYFGAGIEAAGRVRRMAGPKLLRRNQPGAAFLAYRLRQADTIGAVMRLPDEPTAKYHSDKPGVDVIFHAAKRQFTIRLRYVVASTCEADVRLQFFGVVQHNNQHNAVEVVPNSTEFEHQGTLFLVVDVTADGDEGVCEVEESTNPNLVVGERVNFPINWIKQAVAEYNSLDVNNEDENNTTDDSADNNSSDHDDDSTV